MIVNFFIVNKQGVLIRFRGLEKSRKINKRGMFIWHLSVRALSVFAMPLGISPTKGART